MSPLAQRAHADCVIVGASFAGLACATALARRGARVSVLEHGLGAAHAVADFLEGRRADPAGWFVASYPGFRVKRLLRFLFDHLQSDFAFDLLLGTRAMRAASIVYFHHKGVFDLHTGQVAGRSRSEDTGGGR